MTYKFEYRLQKKRYTYNEVMQFSAWCGKHGIDTRWVDTYCGTCYTSNIECMQHLIDLLTIKNSPFLLVPVGYGVENVTYMKDDLI